MANLLIIEDNPEIAELYAFVFADHETVIVNDVPKAIAYLRLHRPDLIITDFHLPSGTGNDVVRYVRHHHALTNVPVLGISVDDTWRPEILALGASAFITKPVDIGELLSTSRVLLTAPADLPAGNLRPEAVIAGYVAAYHSVYRRTPDCRWTGRYFLIEHQRCDQSWLLAETERLRNAARQSAQPRSNMLMRLIDKIRRI